jgi:hypothetical protein
MATARSIPDIFTDLLRQFTALIRTEARLARAEMSENLSAAVIGLALIVVGAVLLIPGLVILLEAAVAALEKYGLQSYWAALAVGGGVLLIGFILMIVGMSRLKVRRLMPSRTFEQIQQDANVAREQARSDHDQIQRAA